MPAERLPGSSGLRRRRRPALCGLPRGVLASLDLSSDLATCRVIRLVSGLLVDRPMSAEPRDPCLDVPRRGEDGDGVRRLDGRDASSLEGLRELPAALEKALLVAVDHDEEADILVVARRAPPLHGIRIARQHVACRRTPSGGSSVDPALSPVDVPSVCEALDEALVQSVLAQDVESTAPARHARPRRPKGGTTTPIRSFRGSSRASPPASARGHHPGARVEWCKRGPRSRSRRDDAR